MLEPGGVCTCSESSHHLVAGAAAFKLQFAHSYAMPAVVHRQLGPNLYGSKQRSDKSCEDDEYVCDADKTYEEVLDAGETKEMRTIIVVKNAVDKTEKLLDVFTAPDLNQVGGSDHLITVPLQDVFDLAGVSLDSPTATNLNQLRCGTPGVEQPCRYDVGDLPQVRQTGLNMRVHLDYHNQLAPPEFPDEADNGDGLLDNHVGPTCKVTISLEGVWQSRPRSDCDIPKNSVSGGSSCTLRYYQGIKIYFSESGGLGIIDPFFILLAIGASLVYLGVPLVIIHELAIGFLGTLSNVYHKADNMDVVLVEQLTGFVARMVTTQMAFSGLAGGDNESITPTILLERIDQCLKLGSQSGLTPEDKIKLTEIVMDH